MSAETIYNSGGATPYLLVSGASTNAVNVKGSQGQVFGVQAFNTNAAARYLKLYDEATVPTVGTDVPVKTIQIAGASAGSGTVIPFPLGVLFLNGISFATTTGAADDDTGEVGAGEIIVNIDFK